LPKIFGAKREPLSCSCTNIIAGRFDLTVGWGELNVEADDDGVRMRVIVGCGLLCTVACGLRVGIVNDLRIRSEQANFGDVWPALGSGQRVNVRLECGLCGGVVVLAKEISFTDCFFS